LRLANKWLFSQGRSCRYRNPDFSIQAMQMILWLVTKQSLAAKREVLDWWGGQSESKKTHL